MSKILRFVHIGLLFVFGRIFECFTAAVALGINPLGSVLLDVAMEVAVVVDYVHLFMDFLNLHLHFLVPQWFMAFEYLFYGAIELLEIFGKDYVEISEKFILFLKISAKDIQDINNT
jgi:hypothetical protein